jgi:hypothetical protein
MPAHLSRVQIVAHQGECKEEHKASDPQSVSMLSRKSAD